MSIHGVPIDEAEPPEWARAHVSPGQLKLNRGLLWILLIYKRRGLESSRVNVAQRLYIHTVGKDRKEANPGFKALADDLELSERTVEAALEDLEKEGWVVVVRRRRHPNVYRLAWPVDDVLGGPDDTAAHCGAPTTKEGVCTRRAGWGTPTPGVGPCKFHRVGPQQLRLNDTPESSFEPQPLRSNPVDNSETEPCSTATVSEFDRNHCGFEPQPLRTLTATIADKYVESALGSTSESSKPPVLAVGEQADRNARDTDAAPTAQPENSPASQPPPPTSMLARSVISCIPRYRTAPPWARKRLAALADTALHAGFGRDAITRYADMVIAEHTFKDHQHIPEFKSALARLGRDATRGDACPEHGTPECFTCAQAEDRPWTDADQAAFDAALDRLGLTPGDLPTGTET